jgi:predicted ATPase/DNA-binding XRE family transcriptional regulator
MSTAADRPPETSPFGTKLRELRIAAGLTQEDLAERTGLSVRGISDLERGERSRPHFETVRLLADALELEPADRNALVVAARPPPGTAPAEAIHPITVISTLPIPATRLVDREQEIRDAVRLLDHGETRLLTMTGPGGVGKTRLAIAVALQSAAAEDAVFVDLAPISDPDLVGPTIVRALGLRDAGDQTPGELLKEAFSNSRVLLVLDNFEQVIPARSLVSDLIATCPLLKVLATSRMPLRLRSEQEIPVPPLALPDPTSQSSLADLERSPAVTLFVQRAQAADPHFSFDAENAPSVIEACHRLDGLPLAIELAAARVKLLSPQVLVSLMERRLELLTGGPMDAPERQRAMTAAVAWSHDLLSGETQLLFRRLAVFAGGFTLEAVEAVCAEGLPFALDQLSELADHSLVQRDDHLNGSPHFRMQEVVREFARERLEESGESLTIQNAHAAYYLDFTERANVGLTGPQQGAWLTRLIADEGNLATALDFAIDQQDAETALRMVGNLWAFWARRGHLGEGRMWVERALGIANNAPLLSRTRAFRILGSLAIDLADFPNAQTLFEASRDVSAELEDEEGFTISQNGLALVARYRGNFDQAQVLQESILEVWRKRGDLRREAITLHNLGDVANALGRFEEARVRHQEALVIQQAIGDGGGIAYSFLSLAEMTCDAGDPATAQPMFERSLVLFEDVGDHLGVAYASYGLGRVASLQHEASRASEQFAEALALRREFGDRRGIIECVEGIAGVALVAGKTEQATRLFGAAATARSTLGVPLTPVARTVIDVKTEALRDVLGSSVFATAWALGEVMTIEQSAGEAAELAAVLAAPNQT